MSSVGFKLLWAVAILLLIWLVLAQNRMTFRTDDQDAREEFRKSGVILSTGIMSAGGRHIHYAMTGADSLPTLFFVHGTPGSWDAFAAYMKDKDLLRKFRMVAIDRPGFGLSDFGRSEHLDKQSLLISPLFRLLNNHRSMFIAGHSMGGPMIIKLAADNPGLFSSLVVISGSIDPAEEKPEPWRPILCLSPLNYLLPGALRPSNQELWYLKKDLVTLEQDFTKIYCPVYFVHGTLDDWVPPANVAYGLKMLIHAAFIRTYFIGGANHFIPWTRFTEIKNILLKLY